jgi:hypothetical protein
MDTAEKSVDRLAHGCASLLMRGKKFSLDKDENHAADHQCDRHRDGLVGRDIIPRHKPNHTHRNRSDNHGQPQALNCWISERFSLAAKGRASNNDDGNDCPN